MGVLSTVTGLSQTVADTLYDAINAATSAINGHKDLTTGVHGAGVNTIEQTGNKNIINGYVGLDANKLFSKDLIPSRVGTVYFHLVGGEYIVVQGVWGFGSNGSQTDFDVAFIIGPGYKYNLNGGNLDEIKFPNLALPAGTYHINIGYSKFSNGGFLEILHGTTVIGTIDEYNATESFNNNSTLIYSPTAFTIADLRIRVNGRNPANTFGYYIYLSRLEIIRV